MSSRPPELIAINHDDYHAKYVGQLPDGRQFFLTTPFEPAVAGRHGSEYVALFVFDCEGKLIESKIDDFGSRDRLDHAARQSCCEERLQGLGEVTFGRIEIKPFAVQQFGTTFGLIPREPEVEEDIWAVELQPGNYMAFFEPWDSGEYDT